jgi:hypothetical protein
MVLLVLLIEEEESNRAKYDGRAHRSSSTLEFIIEGFSLLPVITTTARLISEKKDK